MLIEFAEIILIIIFYRIKYIAFGILINISLIGLIKGYQISYKARD